mmetsp:Transcript_26019/g.40710  ORF Transcript_26019/g.40710 Transcript_26019/m.40710 type:complete len:168 (-) Transcript_26019:291-794(-)
MEGLKRQPHAASSREALVNRCKKILMDDFTELPRSGPWAHRVVDPRRSLPLSKGRTEHPDSWRVGLDGNSNMLRMTFQEWEEWHNRHAAHSRVTPTGLEWTVPNTRILGHTYLPSGSISRTSTAPSSHKNRDSPALMPFVPDGGASAFSRRSSSSWAARLQGKKRKN